MAGLDRLPENVADVVARYAALVRAQIPGVREVIVFGSRARGDAHAESDLDVAVILSAVPFDVRRAVLDLAADVSLASGLDVSPTVLDVDTWTTWLRQERPLAMDIARDGIPA